MKLRKGIAGILCMVASGWSLHAAQVTIDTPTMDRWMYPFNATPGARTTASVFGAVGEESFDERDAQYIIRFDTSSLVPVGYDSTNYNLTSLTLSMMVGVTDGFTYGLSGNSAIELFGVGYRYGFTQASWQENTPYLPFGNPAQKSVRSAYALGFDENGNARDVSNNVADGFDADAWAVGVVAGLTPGDTVTTESVFTFTLDLTNPYVLDYFQNGLKNGWLDFAVTSLYSASQEVATGIPVFYTKENPDIGFEGVFASQVSLEYEMIPEPSSVLLTLLGVGGLAMRWGRSNYGKRHG